MQFRKLKEDENVNGTGYQGHVRTNYTELCQIFGQPDGPTIDGKVRAQWKLIVAGAVPVTIYDYKEDIPVRNVLVWHIGGKSKDAHQLIEIILKEQRKLLKNA